MLATLEGVLVIWARLLGSVDLVHVEPQLNYQPVFINPGKTDILTF